MDKLIGIEFMDVNNDYKVVEFLEQFNMYRLKNYTTNRENELMKKEDILKYLNDKDNIMARREKLRKKRELMEEIERREKEEEERQIREYNKDYGFTNNKSKLQKGKILKILNKKVLYDNRFITRKDLIIELINNYNCRLEEVFLTNRHSQKKIELEYKKLKDKLEFRMFFKDNRFLELTKTEFEFAKYILSEVKKEGVLIS